MEEPVGRSVSAALSSNDRPRIVYILVFLWTIPTFGVFVSSFRSEIAVKTTGWWTFFWNPHFTLQNYKSVLGSKQRRRQPHPLLPQLAAHHHPGHGHLGRHRRAGRVRVLVDEVQGSRLAVRCVVAMLVVPLQMALIPLARLFTGGAHIGTFTIFPTSNLNNSSSPSGSPTSCFGMPFCIFILQELHVVAADGDHRGGARRRCRSPHGVPQAGAAAVRSGDCRRWRSSSSCTSGTTC